MKNCNFLSFLFAKKRLNLTFFLEFANIYMFSYW